MDIDEFYKKIIDSKPSVFIEANLRSFEFFALSDLKEARKITLKYLEQIVMNEECSPEYRIIAIDIIAKAFNQEKDLFIKANLIEIFENEQIFKFSPLATNIAKWWNGMKDCLEISQKSVVIVDDNEFMRKLYKKIFQSLLVKRLYIETDSIRSLDIINKINPALILTDMNRPGMKGLEMSMIIKSNPDITHIPIILCSGYAFDFIKYVPKIFCAAIIKPFTIQMFKNIFLLALAG